MVVTNPFSDIDIKYIPAFLLQMINDRFLLRHTEKIYELQHTSFAMPPSIYNFRYTVVQNNQMNQHLITPFLTSLGVGE